MKPVLTAIDIGNAYCLATTEKHTASLKSIYHVWSPGEKIPPRCYDQVFCEKNMGIIVGHDAMSYRTYETIAETNKTTLAMPFSIALLYRLGITNADVVYSVPDPLRYEMELRGHVEGTHKWGLYGDEVSPTTIHVKGVIHEGFGSWYENRDKLPKRGLSLIVDIGAGTAIAALVNTESASVLDTYVKEGAGVVYIAKRLVEDTRFVKAVGEHPNVADIMNGIEMGTFEYGMTNIFFNDFMPDKTEQWFKWLFNTITTHYKNYMTRITSILFTGGGSLMLKDKIDAKKGGIIHLAADPLRDNVNGAYKYARTL